MTFSSFSNEISLLVSFILYDKYLNMLGFSPFGQTNPSIWICQSGLWETIDSTSMFFRATCYDNFYCVITVAKQSILNIVYVVKM